jgi:hypothetical protein
METFAQLSLRRARILEQIAALGPMRMGTVYDHYLPDPHRQGPARRRGPYPTYTFKHGGKTKAKHLRDQAQVKLYRNQIETFRRWQALSAQLVQVSQRLADLEAAGAEGDKKNSRR